MPKPSRAMKKSAPAMYQLYVDQAGVTMPVGPRMELAQVENFCEAVSIMIARGKEKTWSNPQIVEFKQADGGGDTRTLGDLLKVS